MDRWHRPVFIAFLIAWAVNWLALLLRIEWPPESRWVAGLLPLLAAATSLLALGKRLPLQNVLTAATLIATLSFLLTAIGAWSGIPFGPIFYGDAMGELLFNAVPWTLPVVWVVLIVSGRGVARLIMRPWRKTNYYGFWVIGLTGALAILFDLGLEPLAVKRGYWLWQTNRAGLSWHTAPWVNFLGWFIGALGILVFTVPWLINKQPIKRAVDYHPLIVWLLLNLWVGTANALEQLWPAVVVAALGNGAAAIYAIRGARW